MDPLLENDRGRIGALLDAACAQARATLATLDERPVVPQDAEDTIDAGRAGETGIGAEATLARFASTVAPYLAASPGPRHLGFVTGGATPAALVGDWLAAVHDQNPVSRLDGRAALALERDTLRMLREFFGLTTAHEGVFTSGATMSNFVGLALAREWVGRRSGVRVCDAGLASAPPLRVYAAAPHASIGKALSMLGIGRKAWHPTPCLPGREAIDVGALVRALDAEPGPAIVVASAGTVNTGDFDDLRALAALRAERALWLHVDAAFGAFAAASPGLRDAITGWQAADSICIDLHKWLNVPYDAGVAYTRHRELQQAVFANASDYLGTPAAEVEPIHLAPENSHRWRALPAWFTLTAYGARGHREIVERDCALARELGERIAGHPAFELLAPVRLNIVCFALRDPRAAPGFVGAVRADGRTFVTPTVFAGRPAVRAAFSNWRTGPADLDVVWAALCDAAAGAADAS